MKENLESQPSSDQLRMNAVTEYLYGLEEKRPFDVGDIVVVTTGEYKFKGLKVMEKKGDELIISPGPESTARIPFNKKDLFSFDDVYEAWTEAAQKYPYSPQELGTENDWPKWLSN